MSVLLCAFPCDHNIIATHVHTSHNKVTACTPICSMPVSVPVACLYLYPGIHVLVYTTVAIAVLYGTVGADCTEFSYLPRFMHANVLLRC